MTWALLAFSLLNFAGVTSAIALLSPADLRATAAAYAARFALGHAADDSWKPMLQALDEARAAGRPSIYRTLFFERKIKFQYPPSSLLALDLLERMARRIDLRVLNAISWACILALAGIVPAIYLRVLRDFAPAMWAQFSRPDRMIHCVVVSGLVLTFYPVIRGFALGQIQTWLTCLFAGAVLAWVSGREAVSGALIGAAVTVKPQLGVLLAWGAIQRRRRFVIASAAVVLAVESISVWRYGAQNHLDYIAVLSFLAAHGESFYANQSVNGLLARALHVGNNVEWDARNFPPFHPAVYYGTLVSSCAMVGAALLWKRGEGHARAQLLKFIVASLLFTMASPIAWEHHYGMLIAVYAVLLPMFLPTRKWLLGLALSYVLCSNSFPFANSTAPGRWNFAQSYLFAGAALLVAMVYLRERRAAPSGRPDVPPGAGSALAGVGTTTRAAGGAGGKTQAKQAPSTPRSRRPSPPARMIRSVAPFTRSNGES